MGLESRVEQLEGVLAEIKDEVSNTRSDLRELLDRLNGRGTEASPAPSTAEVPGGTGGIRLSSDELGLVMGHARMATAGGRRGGPALSD